MDGSGQNPVVGALKRAYERGLATLKRAFCPAMEPNRVMDVMQKGYILNGRVIRPARVVVTKSP